MIYLKNFKLPSDEEEFNRLDSRNIHNNTYPFGIFSSKNFAKIEFEPITILCGDNGSGKTTLLNVIAKRLNASKKTDVLKGTNFENYVDLCNYTMLRNPDEIKLITSDDVFDRLLDIRAINSNVSRKKDELSQEYLNYKFNKINTTYDDLKNSYLAHHNTMSGYVRKKLINNTIKENSNGQTSLEFWQNEIDENSIYILDEPENSLSAQNQLKLKEFIESSARFYNCQFIISTHSPILLALDQALIYNLESDIVQIKKWEEVDTVLTYYNFFKDNNSKF